jgi:hypothetical protein
MPQQTINVGTVAGDNTGDPGRTAFQKVNQNFNDLYTANTYAQLTNVKAYGAVGDGVTDDKSAITSALASISSGGSLLFPPGTYQINNAATTCFTLPANSQIQGCGINSTTLRFTASGTAITFSQLFGCQGNVTIRDMTIQVVEVSTQQVVVFQFAQSGLRIINCNINGGVTDTAGTRNSAVHGIGFASSGTQNDLQVAACGFYNLVYPFLKTNASTAINRRITISGCDFGFIYAENVSLNSPLGEMTDFSVINCAFHDSKTATGGFNIAVAIASAQRGAVSNNVIFGSFGMSSAGAIHLEENAQFVVVSNNNLVLASGTTVYGIVLLYNNISGTGYVPQYVTIANNNISYSGTASGSNSWGILLTDNASGNPKNIEVSNNIIRNFDIGMNSGSYRSEAIVVSDNLIGNCVTGIKTTGGGISYQGNTTSNCTTGVLNGGGPGTTLVEHKFMTCTANYNAGSSLPPFMLINPSFEWTLFSPGAGSSTYLALGTAGANDRAYGIVVVNGARTGNVNDVSQRSNEVTWTGAALTSTAKAAYEPGSLTTAIVTNSGNLAVQAFAAVAMTDVRVQCRFNGMLTAKS